MRAIQTTLQLEQGDDVQLIGHGFKIIVKNGGNYSVSTLDILLPDGECKALAFMHDTVSALNPQSTIEARNHKTW